MMSNALLYIASAIIILWGIGHIIPTKSIVAGFGAVSRDNRLIITMEWIAEGLTLCFIGVLVLTVTIFSETQSLVSGIVYRVSAAMLLIMAVLTLVTGAKTSIVPIKICPFVKTVVAILFIVGSMG